MQKLIPYRIDFGNSESSPQRFFHVDIKYLEINADKQNVDETDFGLFLTD